MNEVLAGSVKTVLFRLRVEKEGLWSWVLARCYENRIECGKAQVRVARGKELSTGCIWADLLLPVLSCFRGEFSQVKSTTYSSNYELLRVNYELLRVNYELLRVNYEACA